MCKRISQTILDKKFINITPKAARAWDLQYQHAETLVNTIFQPVTTDKLQI